MASHGNTDRPSDVLRAIFSDQQTVDVSSRQAARLAMTTEAASALATFSEQTGAGELDEYIYPFENDEDPDLWRPAEE
jgi:hypothetical protein